MFTKWEQVEEWIRDNNFAHWVFYRTNPNESTEKINNIIADSNFYTGGDEDKIAMTRKYLIVNGGKAYGVGFRTPNTTQGGIVCEVRLDQDMPQVAQPTAGIGMQGYDMESLRASIIKEIRAEYEQKEYERKRSELERERKEFEEQKNSAIGLLTNYLAPVAQALIAGRGARVAGVDTQEPVMAQPIIPIQKQEQQQTEDMAQQEIFTEQEADKLFDLMARFKKVEPQYMELIEQVVAMAENGDAPYRMAKSALLG